MNDEIKRYLERYSQDIIDLYIRLRDLIFATGMEEIEEKMWAKLPSYYVGDKFVRLIPFKDHINTEAVGFEGHLEELQKYKFTPKKMMQINPKQVLPMDVLKNVFMETLQ